MRFAAFFTTYHLESTRQGRSEFVQIHSPNEKAVAKETEERREAA
jgi:hypothetical protein